MTRTHLREEHQMRIDPMELIDRYQQKRYRKNMLFEMKGYLLKMSSIAEIVNIRDEVLRKKKDPVSRSEDLIKLRSQL
jgi:hypothetical protein